MNSFLLLAGGASTRMGEAKGLMKFRDHTWLEWQLQRISEYQQITHFNIHEVVIVLGYHLNAYLNLLIPLKSAQRHSFDGVADLLHNPVEGKFDFKIVNNPRPECGSFSSLQCGLQELAAKTSGAFVLPVDVPAPDCRVIDHMLKMIRPPQKAAGSKNKKVIIPTFSFTDQSDDYPRGGHPVWLNKSVIKKILVADIDKPESRLDFIIKGLPVDEVARVKVTDSSVIENINTPFEFAQYCINKQKMSLYEKI
jgi:CTP:molybdopterin cytidylyltransferase MocA